MRSDSAPKKTKNGVPITSATTVSHWAVEASTRSTLVMKNIA